MSKNRYAARSDKNQAEIVKDLEILGFSVSIGKDDIFVGKDGINGWFEIKSERAIGKNGKVRESEIKESQKELKLTWRGHYEIVSSTEQIIDSMNKLFERMK